MKRTLTATLLLSLGVAGLSGCYVVSPYPYPGMYPPPAYFGPLPPTSSPPRPGGSGTAPPPSGASPGQGPGAQGAPRGAAQNCQTVTVEGHYETRLSPNGQRETVWVPTHDQQVCQ